MAPYILASVALALVAACAATAPATSTPAPAARAWLYTRTPIPTATLTPTIHPQLYYVQGLGRRAEWDLEQALAGYTNSLTVAPNARVYASRAEVLRLLGEYERAAADVASALKLEPELADAWREKALLNYAQASWEEALSAADKLIELEPENGAAYVLRARVYSAGVGELSQALADFERAAEIDPVFDKGTLVERWNILAELERWEEALLVSHRIINTGSEDPLRYFYRGWSLIQVGRIDEAIQKLRFGLERYPDYPVMLYYALGVAYLEREAWPEAVQSLDVALAQWSAPSLANTRERPLNMTTADILGPLGLAYLELRQCETGAAVLERAIAESPDPEKWIQAREQVEVCYTALTPTPEVTPTPYGTPVP